jgi:hypothetical protein
MVTVPFSWCPSRESGSAGHGHWHGGHAAAVGSTSASGPSEPWPRQADALPQQLTGQSSGAPAPAGPGRRPPVEPEGTAAAPDTAGATP